ncbi:putative ABC transporter permease protein [Austwickia sp. TVS 96-490-7B]|uniref:FecCD family ABC transporter permease n=1 Tax=Austwickia sp. TVS 96-490-7B TaxID=2830843 RepID=UPI001C55C5F3|nr:iron ABC transporter permease [Austwickia sp. TVS 96-490-7B]MBW3084853.1 putative ABC transporter permease protein [Austwickia sp. TVS 96-490-7B]
MSLSSDGVSTVTSSSPEGRRRVPLRWAVPLLLFTLSLGCLLSVLMSLAFGSEHIPVDVVWQVVSTHVRGESSDGSPWDAIVWELRLPRALLALVVGAGLALAGAGMQTLVRNPLADPYLLGLSSGASVGATLVITTGVLSGAGIYSLSLGALLGALMAAGTVYLVAMAQGGLTPMRLVLSGVVLSSAFSAMASFLIFLGEDSRAASSVLFWMLGSLNGATWTTIGPVTVLVLCSGLLLWAGHSWLDALSCGPETAAALGVPVRGVRLTLFVLLGLLVGGLVAISGGIGFVGLIVPHAARLLVGATHRVMIPVAAVAGGLFLVWVDVVARVAAAPQEMPLGVVTGVIGAPVFLALMGRRSYSFGGAR